jgi:hypothetical protein
MPAISLNTPPIRGHGPLLHHMTIHENRALSIRGHGPLLHHMTISENTPTNPKTRRSGP